MNNNIWMHTQQSTLVYLINFAIDCNGWCSFTFVLYTAPANKTTDSSKGRYVFAFKPKVILNINYFECGFSSTRLHRFELNDSKWELIKKNNYELNIVIQQKPIYKLYNIAKLEIHFPFQSNLKSQLEDQIGTKIWIKFE